MESRNSDAGVSPAQFQGQPQPYHDIPTPDSPSRSSSKPQRRTAAGISRNDDSSDTNKEKKSIACKTCRQLKVRCELIEDDGPLRCRRCIKANRSCEFLATPSRRPRGKTGSRVAELEKKIDALTATLGGKIDQVTSRNLAGWTPMTEDESEPRTWPMPEIRSGREVTDANMPHGHSPQNTIQLGLASETGNIGVANLDVETVHLLFRRYQNEMFQYSPAVAITCSTHEIRVTKPILSLSILTAAAAGIYPEKHASLSATLNTTLAAQILCRGARSLELVQALLVLATYFNPPAKPTFMSMNQLVHIFTGMAYDVGLGRKNRANGPPVSKESTISDVGDVEARRTWLGCYLSSSVSAIALRRAPLIRWSPYIEESLEFLSTSPNGLPSDRWLCHLIRIQHVAEETAAFFSTKELTKPHSLVDMKSQYHIKACEGLLKEWVERAMINHQDIQKAFIQNLEAITRLHVHEIAMHNANNPDDFRLQAAQQIKDRPNFEDRGPDMITSAHIESLGIYVRSIHNAFDAFLSMDLQMLRALPSVVIVRNSYVGVALMKIYSATIARGSKLRLVLKVSDLRVDYYLEAMTSALSRIVEGGFPGAAHRIKATFVVLGSLYRKLRDKDTANALVQDSTSFQPRFPGGAMDNSAENPSSGTSSHDTTYASTTAATAPRVLAHGTFANKRTSFGQQRLEGSTAAPLAGVSNYATFYESEGVDFSDFSIFTAEELNAMNNFMDIQGWSTVPTDQGGNGWTF